MAIALLMKMKKNCNKKIKILKNNKKIALIHLTVSARETGQTDGRRMGDGRPHDDSIALLCNSTKNN